MEIDEILVAIEEINEGSWDNEGAHFDEDELIEDVLMFIASGDCFDPQKYAEEVLKVKELDFNRWYA